MSAFAILKSCGQQAGKPYKGFPNLSIGNHKIVKFKLVRNVYHEQSEGSSKRVILIELEDQILFLPQYFAVKFNNDAKKVDELNNDGIVKYLYFGGKRPSGK